MALTDEEKNNLQNQKMALAITIPLLLLFILVISYSFYVYFKNKRNSESNISIGNNTIIKSNPENGGIVIEEIEEEKLAPKRKMNKEMQSQIILKVVSEKDEEYGVDSTSSAKQPFFFLGRT